jgi:hypothetical protein
VVLAIGAVSLFAESIEFLEIEFLEDASVNLLIFTSLGWGTLRSDDGHGPCGYPATPGLATL